MSSVMESSSAVTNNSSSDVTNKSSSPVLNMSSYSVMNYSSLVNNSSSFDVTESVMTTCLLCVSYSMSEVTDFVMMFNSPLSVSQMITVSDSEMTFEFATFDGFQHFSLVNMSLGGQSPVLMEPRSVLFKTLSELEFSDHIRSDSWSRMESEVSIVESLEVHFTSLSTESLHIASKSSGEFGTVGSENVSNKTDSKSSTLSKLVPSGFVPFSVLKHTLLGLILSDQVFLESLSMKFENSLSHGRFPHSITSLFVVSSKPSKVVSFGLVSYVHVTSIESSE